MQIVVRTYPGNYEALSKALEAGYEVKFATQIGNMIEYICEKEESRPEMGVCILKEMRSLNKH